MDVPIDNLVFNLPNKSKLHIVQLHVVQKYMDIANGERPNFEGHF